MVKWIYEDNYLENKDMLFIICSIIIIVMIVITFYFVFKKVKRNDYN